MNFVFGVVCKVPNSFVKSKNSQTSRDFAFRLGKPKVWAPPPIFFHRSHPHVFSLRAILTYVVRASRRPGQVAASCRPAQVFAPVAAQPKPRSSFVAVVVRARQLEGRRAHATAAGRARAAGRADGRREIARGGEARGTESDVEGRNCRCKVVGRFAYMQSLNLYLQS